MQEALQVARGSGWHLKSGSGHNFGRVVCSRTEAEHCVFAVFGTGKAVESAARDLKKRVSQCFHQGEGASKLQTATRHVDNAEHLVTAAELCSVSADQADQAAGLVAEAEERLAEADDALDAALEEAVELESQAVRSRESAEREADLGGFPKDLPLDSRRLGEAAEDEASRAEGELSDIRSGGPVGILRGRIDALRARITTLR